MYNKSILLYQIDECIYLHLNFGSTGSKIKMLDLICYLKILIKSIVFIEYMLFMNMLVYINRKKKSIDIYQYDSNPSKFGVAEFLPLRTDQMDLLSTLF